MGKLLVQVMSTNDRGLVEFTEKGEEVPLSAPKPGLLLTSHAGASRKDLNVLFDKQLCSLLKEDGTYVQLWKKTMVLME